MKVFEDERGLIYQTDGGHCSIVLGKQAAISKHLPCPSDEWLDALLLVMQSGYQGTPKALGRDSKDLSIEIWSIAPSDEIKERSKHSI